MLKSLYLYVAVLAAMWSGSATASPLDATLLDLQQRWATVKYQTPDKDAQEEEIAKLADQADTISHDNPSKAEPLIWEAIILATQADIQSDFGSLKVLAHAHDVLLQAEKINPKALRGLGATTLGELYYQVPAPPLSFGNMEKGKTYLEKGLSLNPNSLEANYWYGDYWYQTGDTAKAKAVLTRALACPPWPHNPIADAGRRKEAQELLAKLDDK